MQMTENKAIALLRKHAPDEQAFDKVYRHVRAVQKAALRIAAKIPDVDIEFIRAAALLHDIGRFRFPPGAKDMIRHGVEGGRIVHEFGLDERYVRVCETHLGTGITKNDIISQKLPLPEQDFVPETKEEKIISYADNLIFGDREGTTKEVIERYSRELGPEYAERVRKQHEEILAMMKQ